MFALSNKDYFFMEDFIIKNGELIDYKGNGADVVIPDSVRIIGDGAFSFCSGLTSVTIPNSVTGIGDGAFSFCSGLASVTIADSVTEIGWGAFKGCSGLRGTLTIPNSVTYIDYEAFRGCSGLTSVTIGNSVESISNGAFLECRSLTSVYIPDSVTEIGDDAFRGCRGLTSINIPDSVTKIEWGAFSGCYNLTSINIPDSVTSIHQFAFYNTRIKRQPQGHIAYKGFNSDMTCFNFQYKEGETYTCDEAELCRHGFHGCLNPLDCFNYYSGENVVFHEVVLEDRSNEINDNDTKVCGRKITIGRRLTLHEMGEIFNELNK